MPVREIHPPALRATPFKGGFFRPDREIQSCITGSNVNWGDTSPGAARHPLQRGTCQDRARNKVLHYRKQRQSGRYIPRRFAPPPSKGDLSDRTEKYSPALQEATSIGEIHPPALRATPFKGGPVRTEGEIKSCITGTNASQGDTSPGAARHPLQRGTCQDRARN